MDVSLERELDAHQKEVQLFLGKCILRLQQYERLIKAIVADHKVSGPAHSIEQVRAARAEETARKTLGSLVGELIGSYVVPSDERAPQDTSSSLAEDDAWIALGTQLSLPASEFARINQELKELVALRNDLVHHFFDHFDMQSVDGCVVAKESLSVSLNRIEDHFQQLSEWAKDMIRMRRMLSEVVQSEAFRDKVFNSVSEDQALESEHSGVVIALREAFSVLSVDGWACVDEAGRWIAARNPEQTPSKYGCKSWRQVVHEASNFKLKYFEKQGRRSAFFQEK